MKATSRKSCSCQSALLSETRVNNMKDFIATTPSEREMEATRRTKARPRFLVNSG